MKHILPFRVYEAQKTSGLTPDQEHFLTRYTKGTWSVNPTTGLVDVQGNFDCIPRFAKRLKSLSGISFGHVSGNFYCQNNRLTSLEGAPQKVSWDFNCQNNKLTSLEGAPQTVGRDFYCGGNQLTSLTGAPQTVDGVFFCEHNRLTSLAGAPETVGSFSCSHNQLTSLAGAPETVGGDFSCFNNQLTSLAGAPQTVGGGFFCEHNRLTSLAGAPETVSEVFWCDEFKLGPGEWNMEGWLEVLNTGTEEAKRLILTLPVFQPEYWNSKIKEQPKETIIQMVDVWDDFPKEIQDEIQIPSNWKDHFENLLDLQRAGIF